MKYLPIIAIVFSIGILSSCTKNLTEEQNQKLNALGLQLDSTLSSLNEIDSAKTFDSSENYFENLNFIQNEMTDTIDRETTFFIDKYYSLRKDFKLFKTNYSKVRKEIAVTRTQLANLKHDGDNGLLQEGQFDKYYHLESNNIILIMETVNGVTKAVEQILPAYEKMNTKIDSIVNSSKQKMGL
jgi:hypothetical protein